MPSKSLYEIRKLTGSWERIQVLPKFQFLLKSLNLIMNNKQQQLFSRPGQVCTTAGCQSFFHVQLEVLKQSGPFSA